MKHFLGLALLLTLFAAPGARAEAEVNSDVPAIQDGSEHADQVWTCVAQSYVTGRWYYWTSYNVYHSRNVALNACIQQNGYTCNVSCRWGY